MDSDPAVQRGSGPIPRLPKSPLPLASNDNPRVTTMAARQEPAKGSSLPRPSRALGGNIAPYRVLGNHVDLSSQLRDRHEWTSQNRTTSLKPVRTVRAVRSQYQIRDSPRTVVANSSLDTTPPRSGANALFFEDGNENITQDLTVQKKPRHRMSLSERTVETLSHISPSPSPTRRRRDSLVSHDGHPMGPPPRPTSQARVSSSRSEPRSPVKQPFRPPGRAVPPSKPPFLPTISSINSTVPLPKASPRTTGSMRLPQRSVSNTAVVNADQNAQGPPKSPYSAQTMRVKSSRPRLSQTPSISKTHSSIFKPPAAPADPRLTINGTKSDSGLSMSLPKRQSTAASSVSSRGKKPDKLSTPKTPRLPSQEPINQQKKDGAKSSAALRSAIAQAKAAHRDVVTKTSSGATVSGSAFSAFGGRPAGGQEDVVVSNQGLLRSRIRTALTSGQLNISAMKLESIPDEVIRMYEPGESSVNWSEVVDLLKFNAADNEITQLGDDVFPDFSLEEVTNSDDKSNPFGGIELLKLHNNQLSSLPLGLRQLERLTVLNLSGNRLTNTCLEILWQLPAIQDLSLALNELTDSLAIPHSIVSKLQALDLSGNGIISLVMDHEHVSSRPLITLNVSNNHLTDLPWDALASFDLLTQLNASNNCLTTVALQQKGFSNLRELDLSNNSIKVLKPDDMSLPSLQTLTVNNNHLNRLPDLSSCEKLITLQAAENKLSEISRLFSSSGGVSIIKNIDLSLNDIKTLDPNIAKIESLKSLQLTGNPLRERKFLSMDTESVKKALLTRLEGGEDETVAGSSSSAGARSEADADYHHIPVNGVLDLSSKGMTTEQIDLSKIRLDAPIHTLRLSNNELTAFPMELLIHPSINGTLKSLDLSHNPLTLDIATATDDDRNLHLPVLQSLYIVSTGLDSVDALLTRLKAPKLQELNISCQRLSGQLPHIRTWFPNCTTLLATDNWFSSVEVDAIRGLEVLDIRNNNIDNLPPTIGLLGNYPSGKKGRSGGEDGGRLRIFECGGNRFRVPRIAVIEKGTEAVLKDLRRMIPEAEIPDDWRDEI